MVELIYVSRAAKRFNSAELIDMLKIFRHNNQKMNISGLFLYDGYGTFIQVLEGEPTNVESLYAKISQDPRHSRINLLGKTQIKQRSFADWSMGFKHLQQEPPQNLDGFSQFIQQKDGFDYLNERPSFAIKMLDYFKVQMKNDLN